MTSLSLDHLAVAVRDLDAATASYQRLLGRAPSWRGYHPGQGTSNVLFRLDNCYLELLAPAQNPAAFGRGFQVALNEHLQRRGEGLFAVAIGTDDLDATVGEVRARGLEVQQPAEGDGVDLTTSARRRWRTARLPAEATRGVTVFFIQHRQPSDRLPPAEPAAAGGSYATAVDHTVIASPDLDAALRLWHEQLGLEVRLSRDFPGGRRIHFLSLGDSIVELVGQGGAAGGPSDALWGVAYRVGDAGRAVERLRRAGVDVSDARPGAAPNTQVADLKPGFSNDVRTLLIQKEAAPAPAKPPVSLKVKRLDHLVLAVQDVEAAGRTWLRTFSARSELIPIPPTAGVELSAIRPGWRGYDAFVELAMATNPEHRVAQFVAERGESMLSFSLEVDDLEAAVHYLRSKGVEVSDAEAGLLPNTRIARLPPSATHGVSLQLIERKTSQGGGLQPGVDIDNSASLLDRMEQDDPPIRPS